MLSKVFAAAIVLAVALVGFGVFWSTFNLAAQPSTAASSGTTTSTTRTQCTSSAGGLPTEVLNGTFTYSPHGQVEVTSVQALVYTEGGNSSLVFKVSFSNAGTAPVYVAGGCGNSLTSSILSGGGTVETLTHYTRCLCAVTMVSVQPGASATAVDPGCWSGYGYRVVGSGSITANLTLSWADAETGNLPHSTSIVASFYIS